MDILIIPLLDLLYNLIAIYKWILIGAVMASWLVSFGVINTYSAFVSMTIDGLYKLTEPVLQPLRRILPAFSGIDWSPIALLLTLHFVQNILLRLIAKFGVL